MEYQQLQHIVEEAHNKKSHTDAIAVVNDDSSSSKISEECAIPDFGAPNCRPYELPEHCRDEFRQLIEEYNDLFCSIPERPYTIIITFQLRIPQLVYHISMFQATIKMKLFNSLNLCNLKE